jgi:hypothetical protein
VAAFDGDLCGERRGVRQAATGACDGADGDSSTLESEVDGGSARRRWSCTRGENGVRRWSALGEGRDGAALRLTGEEDRWRLDPGYLRKEEEEGGLRRRPARRRAMAVQCLPPRTEMGRGRLNLASTGRFIVHVEDDAVTGGGQVGDVA